MKTCRDMFNSSHLCLLKDAKFGMKMYLKYIHITTMNDVSFRMGLKQKLDHARKLICQSSLGRACWNLVFLQSQKTQKDGILHRMNNAI
jgi:hypothetical protein